MTAIRANLTLHCLNAQNFKLFFSRKKNALEDIGTAKLIRTCASATYIKFHKGTFHTKITAPWLKIKTTKSLEVDILMPECCIAMHKHNGSSSKIRENGNKWAVPIQREYYLK
jgi:hypothetical protein